MIQGQIKTKKESGIKEIFGIGLPQENFQGNKEPNWLEVMNVFIFHMNENPQFAADKTVTQFKTLWSRNGIPLMNHHCIKSKILKRHPKT